MRKCCCGDMGSSSLASSSLISSSSVPYISGCGCNNKVPSILNVSTLWTPPTTVSGFDVCDVELHPFAKAWMATSTLTHYSGCTWLGPCFEAFCLEGNNGDGPPKYENRTCTGSEWLGYPRQYIRAAFVHNAITGLCGFYAAEFTAGDADGTLDDCENLDGFILNNNAFYQLISSYRECDPDPYLYELVVRPYLCCVVTDLVFTFPPETRNCGTWTNGYYGTLAITLSE